MKSLRLTKELERVAMRCFWYKQPLDAITDPVNFTAHVLTYGTYEDVKTLRQQLDDEDIREALMTAPPGVFDARSWAYWNLKFGHTPAPPLPTRRLPA
jgi:hypothetical protein